MKIEENDQYKGKRKSKPERMATENHLGSKIMGYWRNF